MAFCRKHPSHPDRNIYVVSHSVGKSGANHTIDVLLVQRLLHGIYGAPFGPYTAPPGARTNNVAMDGACGPITCAFIRDFQERIAQESGCGMVDARVDPVPRTGAVGNRTIIHLNNVHNSLRGGEDIAESGLTPPKLKAALAVPVVETHGGGV